MLKLGAETCKRKMEIYIPYKGFNNSDSLLYDLPGMGEDFDKESGLPHIDHALWNVVGLVHYFYTKREFDDRPKDRIEVEEREDSEGSKYNEWGVPTSKAKEG